MSMRARHCMLALLLPLLVLGGCAAMNERGGDSPRDRSKADTTDREVHLDLIRRMLDQQQYYAALAHIQQLQVGGRNTDELRYLEAETRRELGQFDAAEKLYRSLLTTPLAAEAYHGLGLLFAPRNLDVSIANLRESVRRGPTNASARNDFGYALMRARRYREALPELATAVELDPASQKARNNLMLLMMLTGDEAGLKRIVSEAAVSADVVARLRRDAQQMQARAAGSGVKR